MDRTQTIGTVQTAFELHSYHGDVWLVVKGSPDMRELEPAAAMLVQRNEVDGIRLVRRTDYKDHGFTSTVVMVKRLRAGVAENDPLARANPGRDASWCDKPDDLMGDAQRQVIRAFLSKYLDERRLTPLELLTYEVHAKALDSAGTTLQGALQRIASVQVRGTKQTAVARMKELMAIADDGLARLTKEARANPVPAMPPGGLAELGAELAKQPGDVAARLYRAVAAHLAPAKGWVEKLDSLFQLWSTAVTLREVRVIDSLAAEILATPQALKELAGEEGSRFDLVVNAIDLYVGNLGKAAGAERPPGIQRLSSLLAAGLLPRTLAELRLGLLRHLYARLPLRGDKGLRDEMRATVQVLAHLRSHAPGLARDEEVLGALAARAERIIQPESMSELVGGIRSVQTKADAVLQLVEDAPGEAAKAKLVPYLRTYVAPEDIIREHGARMEAIKTMAGLARRIADSGMPPGPRREMVDILDTAIFDTIRTEILSNGGLPFADKILNIVRLCARLPDGKARQLAGDQLAQALRRPEFILTYLERFPGPGERRDAYEKLCAAMRDSGLVDQALVPSAA